MLQLRAVGETEHLGVEVEVGVGVFLREATPGEEQFRPRLSDRGDALVRLRADRKVRVLWNIQVGADVGWRRLEKIEVNAVRRVEHAVALKARIK